MLPFVILFIVIPLIGVLTMMFVKNDTIYTIASYLPCFSIDAALNVMGNVSSISMGWIVTSMFVGAFAITYGSNTLVFILVTIVLSLLLLGLGYRVVKRRDM